MYIFYMFCNVNNDISFLCLCVKCMSLVCLFILSCALFTFSSLISVVCLGYYTILLFFLSSFPSFPSAVLSFSLRLSESTLRQDLIISPFTFVINHVCNYSFSLSFKFYFAFLLLLLHIFSYCCSSLFY
jgi:hypothetical protein